MRMFKIVISALALGLITLPGLAQTGATPGGNTRGGGSGTGTSAPPKGAAPGRPTSRGGDGEGKPASLTGEKSKAAWQAEAKFVSHELSLTPENTEKTIAAYMKARADFRATYDKARANLSGSAEDPTQPDADDNKPGDSPDKSKSPPKRGKASGDMKQAIDAARKAEADKLHAALAAFLKPEQAAKAMESFGTFDTNWDKMVNVLADMKLDEAKYNQAMAPVEVFVIAYSGTLVNTDRQAARADVQKAKDQLFESLKPVLTEEQIATFKQHSGALFQVRGAPKVPDAAGRKPGGDPAGAGGSGGAGGGH